MQFEQAFDPFRAISASWDILKRAPLAIFVGGFIVISVTEGDDGLRIGELWKSGTYIRWEDLPAVFWKALIGAFSLIADIALLLIACFFMTSFAGVVERVVRTGSVQLADLFDPRGRFTNQLLATLLGGAIFCIGVVPIWLGYELLFWIGNSLDQNWIAGVGLVFLLVIWLPVILDIYLGLRLADKAVSLEGLGPADALRRSWELARGNRFRLALYLIVTGIFAMLGILACGVGVLVTGPMRVVALNESYLRLITPVDQQSDWCDLASGGDDQGPVVDGTSSRTASNSDDSKPADPQDSAEPPA